MARTQAPDYDERRAEIVAQAARIYARDSFLGASISDLAAACKISKSAIYHYYKSKEDILYDVMYSHVITLDQAARDVASKSAPARKKLRELTAAFMEVYAFAADHQRVLLNELDQLPKPRRAKIVAVQRGLIDIVEAVLAELEPSLKRKHARMRATAMLFFGMINWAHTWYDPKGAVTPHELADMAVDIVLGGIASVGHHTS